MRRTIFIVIAAVSFLYLMTFSAYALSAQPKGPKKYIRVAIAKDKGSIELYLKGDYRLLTLHTNEELKTGRNLKTNVYPTHGGLKVGDEDFKVFGIRIETFRDASIIIGRRQFRGIVDIIRQENRTLLVVNHVDLEEYLCGVLYHEVSHRWPYEALKAQAVASRTFALYQNVVNKEKDYDLTNTSFSQVYGGATGERYRTNRAVIKTYGEVLTYNGEIFPAYYHATCGGYTQDASRLWKIDIAPLKGQRCDYCHKSPHYKWHRRLSLKEIEKKLNDHDFKIGEIYSIEPTGYDDSGRIVNLKIVHSNGEMSISGYKFRIIMGTTVIRSANFKVTLKSNSAIFKGRGWGHGVGLCQWGACFLAKKGYKKEEILQYYYPQSKIENIWLKDADS